MRIFKNTLIFSCLWEETAVYVIKSVLWIGDILNRKVSHQSYPHIVQNSSNCTCFPASDTTSAHASKKSLASSLNHSCFPAVTYFLPPCYTEKFAFYIYHCSGQRRAFLQNQIKEDYSSHFIKPMKIVCEKVNEKRWCFTVGGNMKISSVLLVLMEINKNITSLKKITIWKWKLGSPEGSLHHILI